ncbi:MAG: hypothetical protein HY834_12275 [Devosia nanyangense]|uniref:DUF4287 domain-containing protein n=1 Tax=Devosia nanyangense TaxID=1228055 RepID=A0A933L3J3_9HYPH|nr:hypothetical protein [Devosia nanyangense]
MAVRPASTRDLDGPTGRTWDEWLGFFEQGKFATLSHGEIAQRLHDAGVPDWWSQMLTVAYEQHIGRRVPGQNAAGDFSTSVSLTVDGGTATVADRIRTSLNKLNSIDGVAFAKTATASDTPKRSYWRAALADGTKVQIAFEPRADSRTSVNATHDKLDSAVSAERWRAFWKQKLSSFS